jgi:hypothetical protein
MSTSRTLKLGLDPFASAPADHDFQRAPIGQGQKAINRNLTMAMSQYFFNLEIFRMILYKMILNPERKYKN